ncbi:hypothetical protein [Paenibacillus sanfengchensis]|uniref:hypothetical protein n=2 Tax=Paenibacillus TaxID=44249 RepID=UPI002FE1613B
MGILCVLILVASVFALIKMNQQIQGTLAPYRPGKGFWYYRMSAQSKRTYITVGQWVLFLLLIGSWMMDYFNGYTVVTAIGGIIALQVLVKRRIQLHTEIDDASLFELEELGIIQEGELITSLYKDFEDWSKVSEGAKVLALTPDRLIVIVMASPEVGTRYELRLREIVGLSIIGEGKYGQGVIVTLRLADETVINLLLEGESQQDSPEQFIQSLLRGLDRVYTETAGSAGLEQTARTRPEHPRFPEGEPRPVIRHLDLHEAAPVVEGPDSLDQGASSGSGQPNPTEEHASKRIIDF